MTAPQSPVNPLRPTAAQASPNRQPATAVSLRKPGKLSITCNHQETFFRKIKIYLALLPVAWLFLPCQAVDCRGTGRNRADSRGVEEAEQIAARAGWQAAGPEQINTSGE